MQLLESQAKRRALVIDDSADIAFMLLTMLQHAEYDAVMATSASEALSLAQAENFDLVISDIGMPDMDGYTLAKAIRALPGYDTVPMVAITGFAEYDDRDRALAAGFNAHLQKPVDPTTLLTLINDLSG